MATSIPASGNCLPLGPMSEPLGEKLTWTLSPDQSLPFPDVMTAFGSGITPTGMGVPLGAEAAVADGDAAGEAASTRGRQRGHHQDEQRRHQRDAQKP